VSAHDERTARLIAAFEGQFGRRPDGVSEAPGRVNLIGEHVDYNDGLVLPFAIEQSVLVAWASRDDDAVWAYSLEFDEHSRFNLANLTHAAPGSWANYVRGTAAALLTEHRLPGMNLAITGDVPAGAGLSSSAALEVAVAGAFRDAATLDLPDERLALFCQRAENEFVGVQCGVMDQFASTLCERDAALLIDCRSLAHRAEPLRLARAGLALVICDSGVRRELLSSAFNERRRECGRAVATLRHRLARPSLQSLRDVSLDEVERLAGDAVLYRRARHVVSEIGRVAAAVEALGGDDFRAAGELMVESHLSLRDDYEVSSSELDLLVGLATAQPYVLGSRLTGAGFGGCTVSIVEREGLVRFETDVLEPYAANTGGAPVMYATEPQDGLRTWRLPSPR
jgi:galactokinase